MKLTRPLTGDPAVTRSQAGWTWPGSMATTTPAPLKLTETSV
jgi:hypothetical protein